MLIRDGSPSVAVVESAQDGCRGDPSPRLAYGSETVLDEVIGGLLPESLMGPGAVVVLYISLHSPDLLTIVFFRSTNGLSRLI